MLHKGKMKAAKSVIHSANNNARLSEKNIGRSRQKKRAKTHVFSIAHPPNFSFFKAILRV